MNKEQGFVLPTVMILVALISTLFLYASKEWMQWREHDQMRLAMVQAGYAAESAIALRQSELHANPNDYSTKQKTFGEYTVDVYVFESRAGTLIVKAIAKGNKGIQQTEAVELDKQTLQILYWLE
jgi:type II secretory pathway pseudopilin PulG